LPLTYILDLIWEQRGVWNGSQTTMVLLHRPWPRLRSTWPSAPKAVLSTCTATGTMLLWNP
jgi:hypothetical protein